jgi:hypothetical protein
MNAFAPLMMHSENAAHGSSPAQRYKAKAPPELPPGSLTTMICENTSE